ncbi:MAG: hypothetical protein ACD_49C00054G0004 [uncultured bacterium (gcode 4)]|uniref:Uncharacterized protein n=1 Tax=uncultured bacterium (gcode 4) TaxID=1234023 RepID=K2AWW2_9BACT|nr:MAG: hypothetical protein ACD_49C00054G0004 [uncultured bacterium (gcode 4)]
MPEELDILPIKTQKPEIKIISPDFFKMPGVKEQHEEILRKKRLWELLGRAETRKETAGLKKEINNPDYEVLAKEKEIYKQKQYNNINPSQTSKLDYVLQDTTDEKFKKLNENREEFQTKYGKFNSQICEWLKMDNNLSVSVVERESEFNQNPKYGNWVSYMQLTSDPFDDMKIGWKWRWKLYIHFFKNIPDNIISQIWSNHNLNKNTPKEMEEINKIKNNLKNLKIVLNNPNSSRDKIKSTLNNAISFFSKNRKNPELNLLIWDIYLSSLRNDATDEKIDIEIKKLNSIISSDNAVKRFKFLLEGKWIFIKDEAGAKLALSNLQKDLKINSNTELRKNFYALSKYNWAADKTVYAAMVTVAQKVKNDKGIV